MHGLSVGEQAFPTRSGSLPAHEKHQTGRIGGAGAFSVRIKRTVAEPGKSRPMRMAAGVADSGEPVRVAVAVRHQTHGPRREGEHGSARSETVDSDQARVPQLPRDLLLSSRRSQIDAVAHEDIGVRLLNSAHHGSPWLR